MEALKQPNYTNLTLGEFLSADDEVIRRNAISILKRIQAGYLIHWIVLKKDNNI